MGKATRQSSHSGFATFPDQSARERFVRQALRSDPALEQLAFVSESRPTIVFENLTPQQREKVRSALDGLGRWSDDVQFRTTGG